MPSILMCLFLTLLSFGSVAQDNTLTFSYWSEAGPPFVLLDSENSNEIVGGVIKDLAQLISAKLNVSHRFVNIPVERMEDHLTSGAIDLDCITNPIWKSTPEAYHWSPVLFKGADRFLVKSTKEHQLAQFEDLKGKTLGIYKGYTYHPSIMSMLGNGELKSVKISDIDQGIQLLLLDRIDALIDFDMILEYKIKNGYSDALVLADLYAERYDLFCAYSKKTKLNREKLDKVFKDIISKEEITKLLGRYN